MRRIKETLNLVDLDYTFQIKLWFQDWRIWMSCCLSCGHSSVSLALRGDSGSSWSVSIMTRKSPNSFWPCWCSSATAPDISSRKCCIVHCRDRPIYRFTDIFPDIQAFDQSVIGFVKIVFFFVTYTIIQSITSSEMCSLHLTHPSLHTPGAVDTHTHTHTPVAVDTHTHTHTLFTQEKLQHDHRM